MRCSRVNRTHEQQPLLEELPVAMKISEILEEKVIMTNLPGTSKDDILNAMVDLLGHSSRILDLEKVRSAIFEREKIMSTGVGNGFAIPHGKTDAVSDTVAAFASTADGIDYQAIDQKPVRLLFLLVGKDNMVGPHIKLLSRISRLMSKEDFRSKLLAANNPHEIIEIFKHEEAAYAEL
jgi:fructose-specific phosphotransferase system IIA component